MTRPLAIDLFCGLGGWTEGLLAEGYEVIGFDIEAHEYRADALLREAGISMSAMHGHWARHIVCGIGSIVGATHNGTLYPLAIMATVLGTLNFLSVRLIAKRPLPA